ncbi:hypothetical protein GIB67_013134, partial [Kingdonia uniflora]
MKLESLGSSHSFKSLKRGNLMVMLPSSNSNSSSISLQLNTFNSSNCRRPRNIRIGKMHFKPRHLLIYRFFRLEKI